MVRSRWLWDLRLAQARAEVALACGLPRPTASRLLATLADSGLAERLPDGDGWVLGYEATRLGRAADPYGSLVRRSRNDCQAADNSERETKPIKCCSHC